MPGDCGDSSWILRATKQRLKHGVVVLEMRIRGQSVGVRRFFRIHKDKEMHEDVAGYG